MPNQPRLSFFAVCPPGLESIARAELFALGLNQPQIVPGGLEFSGFLSHLYRVNLWSRTVSRVLLRMGEFEAKTFQELNRKATAIAWEEFLPYGVTLSVRATCHKSKLYHSDGVAQRIQEAITTRLEKHARRSAEDTSQTIIVRLDHDVCTLSLDSSGDHLHQRGYRLATAKAPLRETLAAALLLHAAYNPSQPFIDPLCGSGTFAIEAALIAQNRAPGLQRNFAFMNWVGFDKKAWTELKAKAHTAIQPAPAPILASDRDAGAVSASLENAARAGVSEALQVTRQALSALQPPASSGLLMANLPYGRRLGDDSVRDVYAQFGKVIRQKCSGWHIGLLAGNLGLAQQTRLPFGEPLWIENGGLKVPFLIAQS